MTILTFLSSDKHLVFSKSLVFEDIKIHFQEISNFQVQEFLNSICYYLVSLFLRRLLIHGIVSQLWSGNLFQASFWPHFLKLIQV